MDIRIRVKEIKGHCPVYRVGDSFTLDYVAPAPDAVARQFLWFAIEVPVGGSTPPKFSVRRPCC